MPAFLENIEVGTNWRVAQIKGSGATSFNTAYMTFKRPVIIRRVEFNTASPVNTLQVWISRDGTVDPEQHSILVQNAENTTARSVIHSSDFLLQDPLLNHGDPILPNGRLFCVMNNNVAWSLTVEVRE